MFKEGLSIDVAPSAAGTPIIRRNTNTVVFTLTRAEALTLMSNLAKNFGDGTYDEVMVVIEADQIYTKDRD